MATLRVNTTVMSDQVAELQTLLQRLEDISSDVAAVNQQLQWRTSLSTSIRNNQSQHSEYVGQLREIASALSGALSSAVEQYTSTENELVGVAEATASNIVTVAAGGTSDSDDSSWEKDLLDFMKQLFGSIGKITDDDEFGFAGSLFGAVASLIGLYTTDAGDRSLSDILGVFKDAYGSVSKLSKLLDETGLSDMTGLTSSIVGLFSDVYDSFSNMFASDMESFIDSVQDAMDSGVSLVESVYGIYSTSSAASAGTYLEFLNKMSPFALATVVLTTATRFSTSLGLYAADGFECMDVDNALIDSSTAGLTTWVKFMSGGFIDIDSNDAIDTYKNYAAYIGNVIGQYDLPAGVEIGLSAAGGLVAFTAGTIDIAVDTVQSAAETASSALEYVYNALKWW